MLESSGIQQMCQADPSTPVSAQLHSSCTAQYLEREIHKAKRAYARRGERVHPNLGKLRDRRWCGQP
jgi:hypothetical protein